MRKVQNLLLLTLVIETVLSSGQSSSVTRAKVMSNAESWLHPPVPYSQSKYKDGYRTDCSGYVSMAWEANSNYTTDTLLGITTAISKSDLKSGDILLKPKTKTRSGHVTIFKEWVDSSKTKYWGYELVGGKINQAKLWRIPYPYWRNDTEYEPRRYVNIQPDIPDSGWKVKDKKTNQTCLVLSASIITLSINYTNEAGQTKHIGTDFKPSTSVYSEGECQTQSGDQTITLFCAVYPFTTLSFRFRMADTDLVRIGKVSPPTYYMATISASARVTDMPSGHLEFESPRWFTTMDLYATPYGSSFSSPHQGLFINDEISQGGPILELRFTDLQFQAFMNGNENSKTNVVPFKKAVSLNDKVDNFVQNGSQKLGIKQYAIFIALISVILTY